MSILIKSTTRSQGLCPAIGHRKCLSCAVLDFDYDAVKGFQCPCSCMITKHTLDTSTNANEREGASLDKVLRHTSLVEDLG